MTLEKRFQFFRIEGMQAHSNIFAPIAALFLDVIQHIGRRKASWLRNIAPYQTGQSN